MTIEGCDFSDSRPGGAALVAAGKQFVVRYVPYGGYSKGLTPAEVADYQAHGLDIALVWESTANRALSGQVAGVADGRTAQAAAAGLGFPDTTAIYFAVDFDISAAELPALDAYLQGASMILGASRVGVYGGARAVTHCKATGVRWLWQTYAWSYGTVVPSIHLYQYKNGQTINGAAVDLDRAMQADFGQWATTSGGINIPTGDDVDPTLDIPVATATIAPTKVYADRGGVATLIPAWVGAANVGVYSKAAAGTSNAAMPHGPVAIRIDYAGLKVGWVDDSAVTFPASPADTTPFSQADLDAAKASGEADGYAKAKANAEAAVAGI